MFLDPATPIRMLVTVPHSEARITFPVQIRQCRRTTAQKTLVARRQIRAGGRLDPTLRMERTAPPEPMFPAARMLPSTGRRARKMAARSGTITFLVPRTAILRRTPIAEGGNDSRRNHALPIRRSLRGVQWTTARTVPITIALTATAPTVEVIHDLKAHTPAGPDTPADRVVIHGLH